MMAFVNEVIRIIRNTLVNEVAIFYYTFSCFVKVMNNRIILEITPELLLCLKCIALKVSFFIEIAYICLYMIRRYLK